MAGQAVGATVARLLVRFVSALYDFPFFDLYFMGRPVNMVTALWCGLLRCMSGEFSAKGLQECARPQKTLKLYEFEACPFCRKVREALSTLALDVEVYPCPKPAMFGKYQAADDASRFRGDVADPGGKTRFPVLVDDNAGVIRGSEEIVAHLWKTYGEGSVPPWNYRVGRLMDRVTPLLLLPSLLRPLPGHGMLKASSRAPAKPLVLWGYEPSPFVKIVREALCCLELRYLYVHVPHGSSAKRREFLDKYGEKMLQKGLRLAAGVIQVPMLLDPNKGSEPIFESAAIVRYLHDAYGAPALKSE